MVRLEKYLCLEGHEERVWHASWSPDGAYIASCGEDRTIRVWSIASTIGLTSENPSNIAADVINQCIAVLDDGQTRTIRCCEWSPDSRMLASASFDGTVVVWQSSGPYGRSKTNWEKIATLEGHDNEVKSVAWSIDGVYLATCGRDKKIWVWEVLLKINYQQQQQQKKNFKYFNNKHVCILPLEYRNQ